MCLKLLSQSTLAFFLSQVVIQEDNIMCLKLLGQSTLAYFSLTSLYTGGQYYVSEIIRSKHNSLLFGFLTSSSTTRLYRGRAPRQERLTILRAATHETELGDHDFCLSRSHYTDTDPTCRERAATAGIEPGTSSPGVARSTAELPRPPTQ